MRTLTPYQHGLLHGFPRSLELMPSTANMVFLDSLFARYAHSEEEVNAWIKGQTHGMALSFFSVLSFMLISFAIIITGGNTFSAITISVIGWAAVITIMIKSQRYDRDFMQSNPTDPR